MYFHGNALFGPKLKLKICQHTVSLAGYIMVELRIMDRNVS